MFAQSLEAVEAAGGHPRLLAAAASLLSSEGRKKGLGFPGLRHKQSWHWDQGRSSQTARACLKATPRSPATIR